MPDRQKSEAEKRFVFIMIKMIIMSFTYLKNRGNI